MVDASVFDKIRTFSDYQRADEEFQLKKKLQAAEIEKAMFDDQRAQAREDTKFKREAALQIQLQQMRGQGGQSYVDPDTGEVIAISGGGKAPSGYRWAADGKTLEAITGGPATVLPAEVAGRIGLAKDFLQQAPTISSKIKEGAATGPVDYLYGRLGYGDSGIVMKEMAGGKEALVRQLTGAGMSSTEAKDYADQYSPSIRDTTQTLQNKLDRLNRRLTSAGDQALVGRGGGTIAPTVDNSAPLTPAEKVELEQLRASRKK